MIKRLNIGILSLCLLSAAAFRADAQQSLPNGTGNSENNQNLKAEIKALHVEETQLGSQLRTYHDQISPLYDQFRQVTSEIKQLQERIKPIDDQLSEIQKKIKIDEEKLKHSH